jgi:NADH:ubiquinone oxidoreductase subunit 3 (subunit A)
MLGVSHIFSSYRRTATKIAPYESGIPVLGDARSGFSVKLPHRDALHHLRHRDRVQIPWAVAFRQLTEMSGLLIV